MHQIFWGGRLCLQCSCQVCSVTLSWFPSYGPSGEMRIRLPTVSQWLSFCTCWLSRNVPKYYLKCSKELGGGNQWHLLWSQLHMLHSSWWLRSGTWAYWLIWDHCLCCPWGVTKCVLQHRPGRSTTTKSVIQLNNPPLSALFWLCGIAKSSHHITKIITIIQ